MKELFFFLFFSVVRMLMPSPRSDREVSLKLRRCPDWSVGLHRTVIWCIRTVEPAALPGRRNRDGPSTSCCRSSSSCERAPRRREPDAPCRARDDDPLGDSRVARLFPRIEIRRRISHEEQVDGGPPRRGGKRANGLRHPLLGSDQPERREHDGVGGKAVLRANAGAEVVPSRRSSISS